jgi:hypothetical protein
MSNIVIDIVTQFTGKKAFKDADSAAQKLTGSVKRLGAAFGVSLGATAVLRFAKGAASAFIEDEKAATRLTQSVKNLGLAYASDDIRKYIDNLTLATGVADSELRPALQSLLQVTGSVSKSQQMLADAIDISRGSGENLTTVANDLSQAYVGNLRGLRKYNLGLTQAELKASSFADIQQRLNSLFSGSSRAFLATYAGQMQLLANTTDEAKEVIGKDLVDALVLVSGQDGVENLALEMSALAEFTGDAIYGLGVLIDKVNNLGGIKSIGGIMGLLQLNPITGLPLSIAAALAEIGKSAKAAKNTFNFGIGGGMGAADTSRVAAAAAKKAEDAAKKRAADLLKIQKNISKTTADQLKIKKAGTLFDVEQAGIIAALQNTISKEDETRLKLQFAILTGNVSEATKLAGEVAKAQGLTKELVAYYSGIPNAKNPFAGWITTLTEAEAIQTRLLATNPKSPVTTLVPEIVTPEIQSILDILTGISMTQGVGGDMSDYLYASGPKIGQPVVNVKVTLDGKEMTGAITDIQTNNSLSGSQITLQRTLGQFG